MMNPWIQIRGGRALALSLLLASSLAASGARAASLDTPVLSAAALGHGKVTFTVEAGGTGAPAGFAIWWMKSSDFEANGSNWFAAGGSPLQHEAYFTGVPTLHTSGGTLHSFQLGQNAKAHVEIGDLFDETGVTTDWREDLTPGETYVFSAFALATTSQAASLRSPQQEQSTSPSVDCTYSRGWWENHPDTWPPLPPGGHVQGPGGRIVRPQEVYDPPQVVMGSVVYTKSQTVNILRKPSGIDEPILKPGRTGTKPQDTKDAPPNGLIALAHQVIAAKLNEYNGASMPDAILTALNDADALIGGLVCPPVGTGYLDPAVTQSLTQLLSDFNNGLVGTPACITTATRPRTWGDVRRSYR
jgi:hypothetical protein